ncbi:MAG: diaminopimelate epimerase [candidate division Zixibacteria bacterium]|nr:diaminopimelate epimerase [candidate division Zixibacteria bacterium]
MMKIKFSKYHALGNDFIVIDRLNRKLSRREKSRLTRVICARHTGVGADGVLFLSASRRADRKIEIVNADGGWAEKSGNGLRIAGVYRATGRKKRFIFETATSIDEVILVKKIKGGHTVKAVIGRPEFQTRKIPVQTRQKYLINSPLDFGSVKLPVTCLAVGNPHAVLLVEDFDFNWPEIGAELENARPFPNGTNIEFVKVVNRHKVRVAEWERGAGATGSSGTGAAAAVCATVIMGLTERCCEVVFDSGSLLVNWDEASGLIELTGPVQKAMSGVFEFI